MTTRDLTMGQGVLQEVPAAFVVGTASSAFQIEGANEADGRAPSIWDAFMGAAGTPQAAVCDHYHRWREDLDLLASLGVDSYRLSLSWSRILPDGDGRPNERGLAFYERLLGELRERGIAPIVCLYHWDLPQRLQEHGGWRARDTALRFGEYAALASERLGDAVEAWVTINEPFMHLLRGHIVGDHAPGLSLADWSEVAHHLLVGHAQAVRAVRAAGGGAVGMIENIAPVRPATPDPRDRQAAFLFDLLRNQLLLGAVLQGSYPELLVARRPTLTAAIKEGDMEAISAPLDFLGINYYGPAGVRAAPEGQLPPWQVAELDGFPLTGAGSIIDPDGLRDTLLMLTERYPQTLPPLLVTEVGRDCTDTLDAAGACGDIARIEFLGSHLRAIGEAIDRGADVRGCFMWSFLDGFEWQQGPSSRYGLVHVDSSTGARTPKRSYEWLASELAGRGRGRTRAVSLASRLTR